MTSVHNLLEVVNPLIKAALDQNAGLVDDGRVVADISGNEVTLIGHVRTEAQRHAVVRAAWRGQAVMAVVDQIEITG